MRLRQLCLFVLLTICGLLFSGCVRTPILPPATQQTNAGVNVALTSTSPHTGDNTISIMVTDANTKSPVGNANVTATAEMVSPRLPGTPVSGRAQGNGLYNIPVRFGVATRYNLTLHIQRPGQPTATVVFPIEAAQ
jgi:hypothetical protein